MNKTDAEMLIKGLIILRGMAAQLQYLAEKSTISSTYELQARNHIMRLTTNCDEAIDWLQFVTQEKQVQK